MYLFLERRQLIYLLNFSFLLLLTFTSGKKRESVRAITAESLFRQFYFPHFESLVMIGS